MTKQKRTAESIKQADKTMSTLQLWQHQMSALQRASRPRPEGIDASDQNNTNNHNSSENLHSKSKVIYPHLP